MGITFIFTDNEVKDEGFLEYLNNMLSSGEVSNLFARDEMDEITGELVPVMKKQFPRRPPTQENLYDSSPEPGGTSMLYSASNQ